MLSRNHNVKLIQEKVNFVIFVDNTAQLSVDWNKKMRATEKYVAFSVIFEKKKDWMFFSQFFPSFTGYVYFFQEMVRGSGGKQN